MREVIPPKNNSFDKYLSTGDRRIGPEATRIQTECYAALFRPLGDNATLLDVACGDGRQTLVLAPEFKSMVGIDIAEPLLDKASAEAQARAIDNTAFIVGDMRSIPFKDSSFDGVLNGFSSWGFFGPEEDARALQEMARVLRPGGVFVFDYGNILTRRRELDISGVYDPEIGSNVIVERFEDTNVLRTSWIDSGLCYHWKCQREDTGEMIIVGQQQGYPPEAVVDMLTEVGLSPQAVDADEHSQGLYGTYDFKPVSDEHKRIIIRAVKQS